MEIRHLLSLLLNRNCINEPARYSILESKRNDNLVPQMLVSLSACCTVAFLLNEMSLEWVPATAFQKVDCGGKSVNSIAIVSPLSVDPA